MKRIAMLAASCGLLIMTFAAPASAATQGPIQAQASAATLEGAFEICNDVGMCLSLSGDQCTVGNHIRGWDSDFSPDEDINVWLESNGRYMFTFADCGGSKCIWEENNELVLGSPCVATNNKATFQYYINPSAGTGGFQNYGTNLWMLMWATRGDNAILHTWDYPYSDLALSPA